MLRKVLSIVLLFPGMVLQAQEISITLDDNIDSETFGQVTVHLPDFLAQELASRNRDIASLLLFYVGKDLPKTTNQPKVLGTYELDGNQLRFIPRFPPVPDQHYTAIFQTDTSDDSFVSKIYAKEFYISPSKGAYQIESIFPAGDTIPQNVLRFYLYFSHPMSIENPYSFLRIENSSGQTVSDAFVEIKTGLWNHDRTRLTVFIHPGRIKRAVGPNMTIGPVFEKLQPYKLILNREFKDFRGFSLEKDYEKEFYVNDPIYERIDPTKWRLKLPEPQSIEPIDILFDKLIDGVLAIRMIEILSPDDQPLVTNSIQFHENSNKLSITPKNDWIKGTYKIRISTKLEDVCGNTINYIFDSPEVEDGKETLKNEFILEFEV